MRATIKLENGMEFNGYSFGFCAESEGEIVINTCMFGYESIISDPANCNQIVVMTYPLIGNYGIELDNCESNSPTLRALLVNEYEENPQHIKCELDLDSYMKSNNIVGIYGVDTRELTRVIRSNGSMNAKIFFADSTIKIDNIDNPVKKISTKEAFVFSKGDKKIALLDFGVKNSTLKYLASKNFEVKVFPYDTKADEILKYNPDIVVLSSGAGNPKDLDMIKDEILKLADEKPTLAIALGHQLLCHTFGSDIEKLKVGNRGVNYPVKGDNKIYTTSQNTGYYVKNAPKDFEIIFEGVNEKIIQGVKHKTKPIVSLQFDALVEDFDFILDEIMKGK